jgi:hypothetical protein
VVSCVRISIGREIFVQPRGGKVRSRRSGRRGREAVLDVVRVVERVVIDSKRTPL